MATVQTAAPAATVQTMTVRLRIVGVFYDEFVTLDKAANVTIKDVLDKAEKTHPEKFRYRAEVRFSNHKQRRVLSLTSFSHKIEALDPSLGKARREAGIYHIRETVDTVNGNQIVHAWQYYVVSDGRVVSNAFDGKVDEYDVSPADPTKAKANAGFTPFDEQPVKNKDEIIWRNVTIARGPTANKINET